MPALTNRILATDRLLLTPLGDYPSDIIDIQNNLSDEKVGKLLQIPWPYPEDGAQAFWDLQRPKIEAGKAIIWGLRLKSNPDELIGCVHYRSLNDEGCWGRGFWLASKQQNQGYMTEAVMASLDFMFSHAGMKVLAVENFLGNAASRRVKEKTGARFLGVFPRKKSSKGHDYEERWELTKEDWVAGQGIVGLWTR